MSKLNSTLTQERLKELLHYDPVTGIFTWLVRVNNNRGQAGSRAGFLGGNGYELIGIDGLTYLSHRVAWLYVYGAWPSDQIDHKSGVRNENWIDNLRDVSNTVNCQNLKRAHRGNSSGFLGVSWDKLRNQFRAQIMVAGVQRYIGLFPTAKCASEAYLAAKQIHHAGRIWN